MKTPEEIKKGLLICSHAKNAKLSDCERCPYNIEGKFTCGLMDMLKDAYDCINALEETISLMKIQMRGDCGCCKHGGDGDMKRCNECLLSREYHPLWEYEGLPEVEIYEQSEMPVLR